jgi:hypothetical protein
MAEETIVSTTVINLVQNQAADLAHTISTKAALAYDGYLEKNGEPPQCDDIDDNEDDDEKPNKRTRSRTHRHRLTSKLHISALFVSEDVAQKPTQEKIFRNLLTILYGSQPILSPHPDNGASVQQLFDEVRAKAIEWGPKFPVRKATSIANIELSGPQKDAKQFALFLLLRGGRGEVFRGAPCVIPPLLSFINANQKDVCLSPFLAPMPLLLALFEKPDVVERVLEFRKKAKERFANEQKTPEGLSPNAQQEDLAETLSAEFKAEFEPLLPTGIDPQYIDFHVSRSTPRN